LIAETAVPTMLNHVAEFSKQLAETKTLSVLMTNLTWHQPLFVTTVLTKEVNAVLILPRLAKTKELFAVQDTTSKDMLTPFVEKTA
jgi:hypothetical protein